jgi:hypothetical protein
MSDLPGIGLGFKTAVCVGSCRVLVKLVDFPVSGNLLKENVVYGRLKRTKLTDDGIKNFSIADTK